MDFELDDDDDAQNEFGFEIDENEKANKNKQNTEFFANNDEITKNDPIIEPSENQKKNNIINLDDILNSTAENNSIEKNEINSDQNISEKPKRPIFNLLKNTNNSENKPNNEGQPTNFENNDQPSLDLSKNNPQPLVNLNKLLDSPHENKSESAIQETQNQNESGNKKLVFNLFKKQNNESQSNEDFSSQNESNSSNKKPLINLNDIIDSQIQNNNENNFENNENSSPDQIQSKSNKKPLINLDDILDSQIQNKNQTDNQIDSNNTNENSANNETKSTKKPLIDLNEIIDSQIQNKNQTDNQIDSNNANENSANNETKSTKKPLIDLNEIIDSQIQNKAENDIESNDKSNQETKSSKKPLIDLNQLMDSIEKPPLGEVETNNAEQEKTSNSLAVQVIPSKDSDDDDSIDAFQGQSSVFYTDTSIEKTRLPADDNEESETVEKHNLSSLGPPPRPLFKPKQKVSRSVPSSQLAKPRIIRPVTNAGQVRHSKGFSIDKFDPNNPQPFTDPLTREACRNLGISLADIMYPNIHDLRKYTRDPKLHQYIRDRLMQRVDQNIETIKQERDRISCLPDYDRELRKPINLSQPAEGENEIYNNYELETMGRLKAKNKREAEQLLMNIFIEKEQLVADTKAKIRLLELKKQKEEERKEQIRLDKQRQIEMIEKEAKKEKERRNEINRLYKEQQEKDKQIEDRRKEHLENKLLKCQEEEQKRKMKNEAAHKQFQEAERQRLIQYDKDQKELLEREAKFKEKELKEKKERELRIKEEEEQKMKHIMAVRHNEKQNLEQKRKKTLEKAEKQQEEFLQVCKERDEKLEQNKQKHLEKTEHYRHIKHEMELQIEDKNRAFMMNEREKEQRLMERMEEDYYRRQEKALDKKISEEDHLNNANRYEKLIVQKATEKVKAYELRIKQIEEKKEEHRRKVIQAEIMRRELQREKDKIANMGISMKELSRKSPKQLQHLADSLDIDIEAIQEKAKKMTKGRNSLSNDSENNE